VGAHNRTEVSYGCEECRSQTSLTGSPHSKSSAIKKMPARTEYQQSTAGQAGQVAPNRVRPRLWPYLGQISAKPRQM